MAYYVTNQSGFSKKGESDLVPLREEFLVKYKTRETKMCALKRALKEALASREKSAPVLALKFVNE